MKPRWNTLAAALSTLLLLVFVTQQGCASFSDYMRNRRRDAAQMLDIGVTWSSKPCFSLYMNCPVPLGWSYLDGHFAGLRDGRFGVVPVRNRAFGLILWGRETSDCGPEFGSATELETGDVGLVALITNSGKCETCVTSCLHTLHVGFVGLAICPHFLQALDFGLGWFGLDIAGDDSVGDPTPGESVSVATEEGDKCAPVAGCGEPAPEASPSGTAPGATPWN